MHIIKKIVLFSLVILILTGCSVSKDYELNKLGHYLENNGFDEHPNNMDFLYAKVITGEYTDLIGEESTYTKINLNDLTYQDYSYYIGDPSTITIYHNYTYDLKTDIAEGIYWIDHSDYPKATKKYIVLYNYSSGTSECNASDGNGQPIECNIQKAIGFTNIKSQFLQILNDADVDVKKLKEE